MKEILFKGKTEKGKWVYGDAFTDMETENKMIMAIFRDGGNSFDEAPNDYQRALIVENETVTQAIDRKDIDGNEVFELDIVAFTVDGGDFDGEAGVIEYDEAQSAYCVNQYSSFDFYEEKNIHASYFFKPGGDCGDCGSHEFIYSIKVIGNVFDNPEMIKCDVF